MGQDCPKDSLSHDLSVSVSVCVMVIGCVLQLDTRGV